MYKVIVAFRDLQDKKHYKVGDIYTGKRAAELASANNKAKKPLIEEVPEKVAEPKVEKPQKVEKPAVEEPKVEEPKEEKPAKKTRGKKKGK